MVTELNTLFESFCLKLIERYPCFNHIQESTVLIKEIVSTTNKATFVHHGNDVNLHLLSLIQLKYTFKTSSFKQFYVNNKERYNLVELTFKSFTMENQVQLIGRLGINPDSKQINQSVKTTFTLATNTVYRDSEGNKKTMTDWHNIIAWGNLAQTMDQYLRKGDKVGISGRLEIGRAHV